MQVGNQYVALIPNKKAYGGKMPANQAELSQKRHSLSTENKRDVISFAGKHKPFFSQDELRKALDLPLYATEAEFQEERAKFLIKIFKSNLTGLSDAQIERLKPFPKSLLTTLTQMHPNATKEEMEKGFKHNLHLQNPHASGDEINLICAVILAYPKPHPFEYPGRTLGASSPE